MKTSQEAVDYWLRVIDRVPIMCKLSEEIRGASIYDFECSQKIWAEKVKRKEKRTEVLLAAFGHTHSNPIGGDICEDCGLDIRHAIHSLDTRKLQHR